MIDFLDSTSFVCHSRRVEDLETLATFGRIAVIEYSGHGVEVLAAITPHVDSTICGDARRMIKASKPVHCVNLMDQPLIWNSRRIRPEKTELEILACIKRLERTVDEISFPVCVSFLEQWNDIRTAPPSGLIDVPRHLSHHNVTELARLEELIGTHIA